MDHPASQAVLVGGGKFILITDCSAITCLFKKQALSSKLHLWALKLMEYDMDLQWRSGQTISCRTCCRSCHWATFRAPT